MFPIRLAVMRTTFLATFSWKLICIKLAACVETKTAVPASIVALLVARPLSKCGCMSRALPTVPNIIQFLGSSLTVSFQFLFSLYVSSAWVIAGRDEGWFSLLLVVSTTKVLAEIRRHYKKGTFKLFKTPKLTRVWDLATRRRDVILPDYFNFVSNALWVIAMSHWRIFYNQLGPKHRI